jgi:hypothetical protein
LNGPTRWRNSWRSSRLELEGPRQRIDFGKLASGNVIYEQLRLFKMRQYFHVKLDVSCVSVCTLSLVEKLKEIPAFWATACFFWRVCVSSSCVDWTNIEWTLNNHDPLMSSAVWLHPSLQRVACVGHPCGRKTVPSRWLRAYCTHSSLGDMT